MPNPFPGMDPYLEGDLWTTVHTDLCVQIAHQLAPKLRPKYAVLSTRRMVIAAADEEEQTNEPRYPAVGVLSSHEPAGSAATAVAAAPLVLPVALPEPIPHISVEIRDMAHRRLVTCIEVLSPTNKRGTGRVEYEAKRWEVMSGNANLFEIDLLRAGARFPAAAALPPAPYFVFISRAEGRRKVEVWPILLEQPLPTVPVPLLPGDPDVPLDLQAALSGEYDIIGYDELVDYSRPPPGPLTADCTLRDFLQHEIAVFRGISRVGGFLGGFAEPPKRAIIARTPHFLGGFRRSSVRKSRKVQRGASGLG